MSKEAVLEIMVTIQMKRRVLKTKKRRALKGRMKETLWSYILVTAQIKKAIWDIPTKQSLNKTSMETFHHSLPTINKLTMMQVLGGNMTCKDMEKINSIGAKVMPQLS